GMRQAGVLAAGALYALDHHRARIAEDHAAARRLADELRAVPGATVVDGDTNQVNIDTEGIPAERLIAATKRRGVLVGAMGRFRTRAVTHLDVSAKDLTVAAQALAEALAEVLRAGER